MRVLIVDDEHLARQAMRRLLAGHPEVEIAGEADGVTAARREIDRLHPDLVFLDIDLGGGDGFDLLGTLAHAPIVVFVTAHAEHAVDAFAVDAVDYLLKPVESGRLASALDRARRALARRGPAVGAPSSVIAFRTPRRTVLASPSEVVALRADGDFTHVFVDGQPPLMIWRTLGHFENLLPAPPFLRLGRSLIVNRDRLRSVETPSRETARLALRGMDEVLTVGRAAAARLREALEGGLRQPDGRVPADRDVH